MQPHNCLNLFDNFFRNFIKLLPYKFVDRLNKLILLLDYNMRSQCAVIKFLLLRYIFYFKSDLA